MSHEDCGLGSEAKFSVRSKLQGRGRKLLGRNDKPVIFLTVADHKVKLTSRSCEGNRERCLVTLLFRFAAADGAFRDRHDNLPRTWRFLSNHRRGVRIERDLESVSARWRDCFFLTRSKSGECHRGDNFQSQICHGRPGIPPLLVAT